MVVQSIPFKQPTAIADNIIPCDMITDVRDWQGLIDKIVYVSVDSDENIIPLRNKIGMELSEIADTHFHDDYSPYEPEWDRYQYRRWT